MYRWGVALEMIDRVGCLVLRHCRWNCMEILPLRLLLQLKGQRFKGQRNDGIITAKSMLRFYLAFTSGHRQKKDPQLIPQSRDKILTFDYIYVTVNMCNQGICVFTENFREYAYSLKWSGNTRIP